MKYCSKCGTENQDAVAYCTNCGTPLNGVATGNAVVPSAGTPGKGMAIASMVCGIVSFFCFGIVLGVLALIFGGVAKSKGYTGGMATAGIVLGCVGLGVYVALWIACGSMVPFMS